MAQRPTSRRLPRAVRSGLWSLAGLVCLVIVGVVGVALTLDPNSFKPRIVVAVKQATGRDLTLAGDIHLGLSLQPTLTVSGVSFANPPGFSRPEMAKLDRLDLKLALLPLLSGRVGIARLVLVGPDIIVETNAEGRPNWQFTPAAGPSAPQPAAGASSGTSSSRISFTDVEVRDGTLTWRDGVSGRSAVLGVTSFRALAPSPDANLHVAASATYNGTPFTLSGDFGPLTGLQQTGAAAAWPVQMDIETAGAKLVVVGSIAQPQQARGYNLKVTANVPDVAALSPFLPGQKLPPLHDVSLAAQIADSGGAVPKISSLTLHVGASDLTGTVAGLKLVKLDVSAPQLDQPVHIAGQGTFDNAPATLAGTFGAPVNMLPGAKAAAMPIDVDLQALGSRLAIKGSATREPNGHPSVAADVTADMIDLDALSAALAKPTAQASAAVAAPAPARPASSGRMIPDTPIPFELLRRADADVKLAIAQLKSGGALYRAIATHLVLRDGKLQLNPVSADLPEGHLDGTLSADATQANPQVALRLRLPALALQAVFAALHEPAAISGNLAVQADLRGAGTTPHAIAASLDGSLGLSMANGMVDNRILGSTLGSVLRAVNLLDLVGRGGSSQVQCFAARLDASHGIATVRSLVFASSLLTMDGDGSLNLGAETLDLRVRPQTKVVGTDLVVPLRVTGPWRSPSAVPDPAAAVTQNAGTVAGAMLGGATPLGMVAGVLGGKQLLGGSEVDCGAALAAARGTAGSAASASPAPQSAARPAPQLQPKLPNVGGVLKQLFH